MKMSAKTWIPIALVMAVFAAILFAYVRDEDKKRVALLDPAGQGWDLMDEKGCITCHQGGSSFRAPDLRDLFGSEVILADGSKVRADAAYIRESLLAPKAKIVGGYQGVMPSYEGKLSESEISLMIEAMKPGNKASDKK